MRSVRERRGFTLIELMIVVAIVGVLAAIAIPNYLRQVLRAKQTEASIVMGSIKTGQISFNAAHGCFARVPPTPPGAPGPTRQNWVAGPPAPANLCSGAPVSFDELSVRPTGGAVYYQYACDANLIQLGAPADDFVCSALGDLDGDGVPSEFVFCTDTDQDGVGMPSVNGTACNFPGELTRVSVSLY